MKKTYKNGIREGRRGSGEPSASRLPIITSSTANPRLKWDRCSGTVRVCCKTPFIPRPQKAQEKEQGCWWAEGLAVNRWNTNKLPLVKQLYLAKSYLRTIRTSKENFSVLSRWRNSLATIACLSHAKMNWITAEAFSCLNVMSMQMTTQGKSGRSQRSHQHYGNRWPWERKLGRTLLWPCHSCIYLIQLGWTPTHTWTTWTRSTLMSRWITAQWVQLKSWQLSNWVEAKKSILRNSKVSSQLISSNTRNCWCSKVSFFLFSLA